MEIRSGIADPPQCRGIDPRQRPAEASAGAWLDRADIMKLSRDAIGEVHTTVTRETLQIQKVLPSILPAQARAAIRFACRAFRIRRLIAHICSPIIQT